MKKKDQKPKAISVLYALSKLLEDSKYEILRLYSEDLAKNPFNSQEDRLKLTSEEKVRQLNDDVQYLSVFLKVKPLDTLVFAAIYSMNKIMSCSVDTIDIARFFDISSLDILPLRDNLLNLMQKGAVRMEESRTRKEKYRITSAVECAFDENKPYKPKKPIPDDRYKFCKTVSLLIAKRSHEVLDTEVLFLFVQDLEKRNQQLSFIKNMMKLLPNVQDRILFYEICNNFINDRHHGNTNLSGTLNDLYGETRNVLDVTKTFQDQTHPVIDNELVEMLPAKYFEDTEVTLTENGKRRFLEEDYEIFSVKGGFDKQFCEKQLIRPDDIPKRELFFNEKLSNEINSLKQTLEKDKFEALQKRLAERALTQGVAVLLYGLPGTGKTAVAEMLAKETGRGIYHVDIAASKSCWFGESEKQFKKIFSNYRSMCKTELLKPILLFNEADALFSKRRDIDSGSCSQTENALQNILLEELESLDGILIATTNLCDNLDSAFDRRFLFKIPFGKPNVKAKQAIWHSKLEWLPEAVCKKLAADYDLSGGEIDNIIRKTLNEELRTGLQPTLEMIESWCRDEKLVRRGDNAIGFACSVKNE